MGSEPNRHTLASAPGLVLCASMLLVGAAGTGAQAAGGCGLLGTVCLASTLDPGAVAAPIIAVPVAGSGVGGSVGPSVLDGATAAVNSTGTAVANGTTTTVGSVGASVLNGTTTAVGSVGTTALNGVTTSVGSVASGNAVLNGTTVIGSGFRPTLDLSPSTSVPVVVGNVAAGQHASDAVNVGQLRTATSNSVAYDSSNGARANSITFAGGQPGTVELSNVGPAKTGTDAVNLDQLTGATAAGLTQANAYTDTRFSALRAMTQREIENVQRDAFAGTAAALAATGLRYDDRPGRTAVAGAVSYYHDQAGVAFGLGHTSEDGRLRLNAAVTVSPTVDKPDVGAVVGGSWSFN